MVKNIKNNGHWLVILAIIGIGFFLRYYHFSDWLHFELDQSRDAKIVDLAMEEGIGNLPLLGPKAAGSFLRLGPIFYYFNYISALVFGNTPAGIAIVTLIFGTASIPVFYLLMRRYFEVGLSIGLAAIFSFSIYLVMYSRFSWNPNMLPFFIILINYSLLRACDIDEKNRGRWLVILALCLGIATQLHFLAFVILPVVAAIFLIIKRPKIKITHWIAAIFLILLLYSPVVINEIKTGGDNFKQFSKVVEKKSTKEENPLPDKIFKNITESALGHFLILSGLMDAQLPTVKMEGFAKFNIKCDQNCRDNFALGALSVAIYFFGVILVIKNAFGEKKGPSRDFLLLTVINFFTVFICFIPISYDISPRFFLLMTVMPFIFTGSILKSIGKIARKKTVYIYLAVFLTLIVTNLYEVNQRFSELKKAPVEAFKIDADRILKEKTRVTLNQQEKIIDYVASIYKKNAYPVYLNSDAYFRRSFFYHLDRRNIPYDDLRNATSSRKIYAHGNYFLIYPTLSNTDTEVGKYLASYTLVSEKEFGTLTLIQLQPKVEAVNAVEQEFKPKGKPTSAPGVPVRCRWNEIFSECNTDGLDENEE